MKALKILLKTYADTEEVVSQTFYQGLCEKALERIKELEERLKTWHSPENLQTACRVRDERIKELEFALNKLHRCTCTRSWPRAGRHEESCQEYIIEQALKG